MKNIFLTTWAHLFVRHTWAPNYLRCLKFRVYNRVNCTSFINKSRAPSHKSVTINEIRDSFWEFQVFINGCWTFLECPKFAVIFSERASLWHTHSSLRIDKPLNTLKLIQCRFEMPHNWHQIRIMNKGNLWNKFRAPTFKERPKIRTTLNIRHKTFS